MTLEAHTTNPTIFNENKHITLQFYKNTAITDDNYNNSKWWKSSKSWHRVLVSRIRQQERAGLAKERRVRQQIKAVSLITTSTNQSSSARGKTNWVETFIWIVWWNTRLDYGMGNGYACRFGAWSCSSRAGWQWRMGLRLIRVFVLL
jgi:hypothetical protein